MQIADRHGRIVRVIHDHRTDTRRRVIEIATRGMPRGVYYFSLQTAVDTTMITAVIGEY
ncbi:MAG: hypothetical protein GF418_04215 [Chitinivibrionales bacterium]|nr:hypothetical protein [Chitinivibrionales bacterium]MBD3394812.1 hypothetical protein [Chitinivibrionales bacterium]